MSWFAKKYSRVFSPAPMLLPAVDEHMNTIPGEVVHEDGITALVSGRVTPVGPGPPTIRADHKAMCVSHLPCVYEENTEIIAILPDNEITIVVWLMHDLIEKGKCPHTKPLAERRGPR